MMHTELNSKFESLNNHVRKLETQVVQTGGTVKRQEAFIKGKGDESLKHHVNAIIDEDLWQVVKKEKLREGDFQEMNIDRWRQKKIDRHRILNIDRQRKLHHAQQYEY